MRAPMSQPEKDPLRFIVILLIALLILAVRAQAQPPATRDAALLVRAVRLFEGGDERAGMHVLRDYLAAQPDDVEARRTLASFYEQMGLVDAARTELKAVVATVPRSIEDRRALMRLSLRARAYSEALEIAQGILASSPDDADALLTAGRSCFNLRRIPAAESYLAHAVDEGVQSGEAHNMLGLIHLGRKEYKKARGEFAIATELGANEPMFHNNLAYTLELSGDLEGAFMSYDRALTLSPKSASIEANLRRVEARLKRRGA